MNKVDEYLNKFSKIAENYLKNESNNYVTYNQFFQKFFSEDNFKRLEKLYDDEKWEKIKEIGNYVQSFQISKLAQIKVFGNKPNHPVDHYIKVLKYIKFGKDDDLVRFNNLMDDKSGYKILGFKDSSISEIISHAFPNKYAILNRRNLEAIKYLNLDYQFYYYPKFGDKFIEYNKVISEKIKPLYETLVIPKMKQKSNLPIMLQIHLFFNWLYINCITDDILQNESQPKGKLKKLIIKNYNQFQDFELDFTYPKDYRIKEKANKPLEKICFIGQSGTGKTSLLDTIRDLTELRMTNLSLKSDIENRKIELIYEYFDYDFIVTLENRTIKFKTQKNKRKKINDFENIDDTNINLIYFPVETYQNVLQDEFLTPETDVYNGIIDFKQHKLIQVWKEFLKEIDEFKNKKSNKNEELINALKANPLNSVEIVSKIKDWENANVNPLISFANVLNPIFEKFNIRISDSIEYGKTDFLKVETINGGEIPTDNLSSGTKQIISKALPLYQLEPADAIILFDEVENSLYPDTQRLLVDFYINLTNNCQCFFATHSPIIASQFEPCERFILKFDEKGFVKSSMGLSKEGSSPNENLTLDFRTEILSIEAEKAWKEYCDLKSKYHFENTKKEKEKIIARMKELDNLYSFTK